MHIHMSLTSAQIFASPAFYRGHMFVGGGEMLKARRLTNGTQIETLQLPLDSDQRPVSQLSQCPAKQSAHPVETSAHFVALG